MKIDHTKQKLNDALGLKSDMIPTIDSIVKDYFVSEKRGIGHGKASLMIEEIINKTKKEIFEVEDQEIQEYEASLAYLAYVVGLEVAAKKVSFEKTKQAFVSSLLGGKPKPLMGEDKAGSSPREPIVFKCDSEIEEKLFQSVIDSMSKENWSEALQSLINLKDIKLKGK